MRRYTYVLPAEVIRVIDGDTVTIDLGIYPNVSLEELHVRVEGINAPELSTPEGKAARDFARTLLPVDAAVEIIATRTEKFGRLLARIRLSDGRDYGETMIAAGHAVVYNP